MHASQTVALSVRDKMSITRDAAVLSDRLIMLTLFIVSGGSATAFRFPEQAFYMLAAISLCLLMLQRKAVVVPFHAVAIFSLFAFILMYQSYAFDFFPAVTILGFLARLFVAYAAVVLVRDFPLAYVDVIYGLGLMSFLFYIPQQAANLAGFDFPSIFTPIESVFGEPRTWQMRLFFHTFMFRLNYRNAGFFWEPGAFAGYLILGIIFLSFLRKRYDSRTYWKRLIVLSGCLLSTFSTTGYVVFPLALFFHLRLRGKNTVSTTLRVVTSAYVLAIGAVLFVAFVWGQPFMKAKIVNSVLVTQQQGAAWESDRLGSLLFDLDYIVERPFTGWGLHENTRNLLHPFLTLLAEKGRGNGFSDFAAKMGVPALLIWIFFVSRYLYDQTISDVKRTAVGLFCMILVLNGECFLGYPLFLCFFFLTMKRHVRVPRLTTP